MYMFVKLTKSSVLTTGDVLGSTCTRIKVFKAMCSTLGNRQLFFATLRCLANERSKRSSIVPVLEPGWASRLGRCSVHPTCVPVPRV